MSDDTAPDEGQEPGIVETPDGVQHVGEVPADAAVPDTTPDAGGEPEGLPPVSGETKRTGWYRTPSSFVMHADGPGQRRAFADRGFVEITEDEAKELLAKSVTLEVDPADTKGTFDAAEVEKAVREEGPSDQRTFEQRSEAAKKAAATRRANRAAEKAEADHLDPEG